MKFRFAFFAFLVAIVQACTSAGQDNTILHHQNGTTMNQTPRNPRTTNAQLVSFTDPEERAFSLQVPRGWKVDGRLNRKNALNVSPCVRMVSPDSRTHFFFGDPNLFTYAELDEWSRWMGMREGQFVPGYENTMVYLHYRTGQQYAMEYAQNTGKNFGGYQQISVRSETRKTREIASRPQQQQLSMMGARAVPTGGVVTFRCGPNGEFTGKVIAVTNLIESMAGKMWTVEYLAGYVTAEQDVQAVEALFQQVLESFRSDQKWEARQAAVSQGIANAHTAAAQADMGRRYGEISRTLSETNDIIVDGWNARQQTLDNVYDKYSNAFRGTEDVINPETQTQSNIWDEYKYYWQAPDGTIYGTNIDQNPNPGVFVPLKRRQ